MQWCQQMLDGWMNELLLRIKTISSYIGTKLWKGLWNISLSSSLLPGRICWPAFACLCFLLFPFPVLCSGPGLSDLMPGYGNIFLMIMLPLITPPGSLTHHHFISPSGHQVCVAFLPLSNSLWYQLSVMQFNSILSLSPEDSVRSYRLKAESHKTVPPKFKRPIARSRLSPVFLINQLLIWVSMTPSLGFLIF